MAAPYQSGEYFSKLTALEDRLKRPIIKIDSKIHDALAYLGRTKDPVARIGPVGTPHRTAGQIRGPCYVALTNLLFGFPARVVSTFLPLKLSRNLHCSAR